MTATAPRAWAAARFAVASTTAGEGRMTARARANPGEGSRAPAGGRVARWGARVGNARWVNGGVGGGFSVGGAVNGNKVVAAVAVNGKASRPSIDEMDMDPEHVKFASQDELDQRCVGGSHLIRRPLHSFASPRARFTRRTPGARAPGPRSGGPPARARKLSSDKPERRAMEIFSSSSKHSD